MAARKIQIALLLDVLGPPILPVLPPAVRLAPEVIRLVRAAYNERLLPFNELDPKRLGILSDALEEAGCSDEAILSHLRSSGPHICGCWALDLVLGKQ
jgi:hypothetical protein